MDKTGGLFRRVRQSLPGAARVVCGLVLLTQVWPVRAGAGQVPSASQSTEGYGRPRLPSDTPNTPDALGASNARKMEKMREDDRRKRLIADTARLVALSGELQSEVEKASKDELSLDVVKKAAEIEKLARDVKERMKS